MKILLVEDDVQLGGHLKAEIEECDYTVTWVRDAHSAKTALAELDPDVILLDLMLPDGSGYMLLESIRETDCTPVIVISGRSLGEDKVRAFDLGADDYLTKPFWTKELTARIRAVQRRYRPVSKEPVQHSFGDVRIDMIGRQVHVAGRPIALTPTEFDLVQFFVQRPQQALRRERIIDSVFRNPDSASEALQTHISRLRKKLGPDGARIETVWGIGYRLNCEKD